MKDIWEVYDGNAQRSSIPCATWEELMSHFGVIYCTLDCTGTLIMYLILVLTNEELVYMKQTWTRDRDRLKLATSKVGQAQAGDL